MKNKNYKVIDKKEATANWWRNDAYIYLREKTTDEIYRLKVEYDDWAESPREWDNLCTIFSQRGNWDIGDKGFSYPKDEAPNKYEEYKERQERGEIFMVPIYVYEHSGMTISLSSFGDPWDSGVGAFIFVEKKKVFAELDGVTEENWRQKAYKAMEQEVDIYDQYIRGEVYGWYIEKAEEIKHKRKSDGKTWTSIEWEHEDGCGGYYGDPEESGLFDDAVGNRFDYVEEEIEGIF